MSPQAVSAKEKPPDKIDSSKPCVSSKCHTEMKEFRHVHWTDFFAVGKCQECHEANGDEHDFSTDEPPALCVRCHEQLSERVESAELVHAPVEDGCFDCHDPHGAQVEALLVGVSGDDISSICFECHETEIVEKEFKHGPADLGACNMCHDPHASSTSALLHAEGADLCGECHEEIVEGIATAQYVHAPVEDGCIDCHDPHSGPYPRMLPAEKRQLCNECHDDIVDAAESAAVDHAPVLTKDECLNCHTPHAANAPPNLRKPQRELCLGCHSEPVESGGKMLQDIGGWLRANKEWHKPVLEDDCAGCHQPHGSANFRLLKQPYPARFYTSFAPEKYDLCFSCHEEAAVTVQWTRKLTNFRDGDRNMHFLHVNREKRGRTCRACHEVHASAFPLHLREKVPYGKWMMPLNYVRGEKGGSCHPGCHKLKKYDREAGDYPDKDR